MQTNTDTDTDTVSVYHHTARDALEALVADERAVARVIATAAVGLVIHVAEGCAPVYRLEPQCGAEYLGPMVSIINCEASSARDIRDRLRSTVVNRADGLLTGSDEDAGAIHSHGKIRWRDGRPALEVWNDEKVVYLGDLPSTISPKERVALANKLAHAFAQALYGPEWQRPLARGLGPLHPDGARASIDDRLVRRWAAGERPIPAWVRPALRKIAAAEIVELKRRIAILQRI